MKKYFIFAASALALAGCSSDDYLGNNPGNENGANTAINFSSVNGTITRADNTKTGADAATALGNNFVVVGFKGSETEAANTGVVFDHYNVNYVDGTAGSTDSNTKGWEYVGQKQEVRGTVPASKLAGNDVTAQTIKYWDRSAKSYDFLAFSMGKGTGEENNKTYAKPTAVKKDNLASEAYTLTGTAETLKECYISDMKTVEKASYGTDAVQMQFRHLNSKVRLAFFETVPGYVISDVKFYEDATGTTNGDKAILYGTFNNHGTMTVFFPTTGTKNKGNDDYNKAHVKFSSTETDNTIAKLEFAKITYGNQLEDAIPAGITYMSQDKSQPSYCGTSAADAYINVLPMQDKSDPATIRIDYKLTATDGSNEVINVKGATATVPAQYTAWKPGYAYTYIFKIAQNTNGSTDPDDPNKTGLTAISFDAVVLNDEVNGQETVTTVSDPSITTYGYNTTTKKVTTDGNEYKSGTEIYATVHIPATGAAEGQQATTKAPQKLYTVTLETGAAQTINESSVANAIAKGTKDNETNPTTWTVTDANNKKMVVTTATGTESVTSVPTEDGTGLTVNALKWTAGAAGTYYAVEYTDDTTSKKTYKIVKISE